MTAVFFFFFLGGESVQGHLTKSSFLLITHRSNLKLFVLYVSIKLVLSMLWQIWFVEIFLPSFLQEGGFCASSLQSQDSLQFFLSSLSNPSSFHKLFLNKEEDQREAGCRANLPTRLSSLLFVHADLLHFHNSEKTFIPRQLSASQFSASQFPFISSPAIMER